MKVPPRGSSEKVGALAAEEDAPIQQWAVAASPRPPGRVKEGPGSTRGPTNKSGLRQVARQDMEAGGLG